MQKIKLDIVLKNYFILLKENFIKFIALFVLEIKYWPEGIF